MHLTTEFYKETIVKTKREIEIFKLEGLNDTMHQCETYEIYITHHPTIAEYIFFSSSYDHILYIKIYNMLIFNAYIHVLKLK